jgi:hypothetical protein
MFGEARAPAVTQDSLVARLASGAVGFQTLTNGLRRVIWRHVRPSVFAGTSSRVPALLVILISRRRHLNSGRATHRGRGPFRAQSDSMMRRVQ